MNIYETKLRLRSTDVGIERRLRPSVLLSWIQESAIAHTQELGMGREKTLDKGLLWVVTMHSAKIERMPVYDEDVVLRTWPGPTMHLIFPRYFGLFSADGEALVKASSLWSLIDSRTRSIVFPEKHGITIDGQTIGGEIPLPSPVRKAELKSCRSFTVPYSFVDLNGHMNNARYLDLAEDCIYEEVQGRELKAFRMEFIREVRLGDCLELSCGQFEDRWLISGGAEKPAFRIELTYSR